MEPDPERESEAELVDCMVRVMRLTASGSWPWLGDLRAASQQRRVNFVHIIKFFDAHPQRLENFLTECGAGRAAPAILEVLDAIVAEEEAMSSPGGPQAASPAERKTGGKRGHPRLF